ncbi:sensor histidine kinase [Nitrosopumilus sp. S4]
MKIVTKAYLLIAILIGVAVFNLLLLYQDDKSDVSQSYSIIRAGDVKVKAELISSLATSIASGNIQDKEDFESQIKEIETTLSTIKHGGIIKEQLLEKIPETLTEDYDKVESAWKKYKNSVLEVEKSSIFDSEATQAMNYVLQKNQDLILLTNNMKNELEGLDRNFNAHKKIAGELAENAKIIGQQTLLISIGEDQEAQNVLAKKNLEFEIGIRKLLQLPTSDLDVESVEATHETLDPIPRENSESLRKLDPLWESIKLRIQTLEEKSLLSPEFNAAKNKMNLQKNTLFDEIDGLLNSWNNEITNKGSEKFIIIQILLVVDIAVFFLVLLIIRQSLSPLGAISKALSKVKEGIYGEKIQYSGTDEIGQLIDNFNIMSNTIQVKEEEARKTDIAKDEFLAMITHELKTPLVPIQGYSDILLSEHLGKLTDKQKERIGIIKSSSETLLSIISDLLDAQKLDLGQLKMKKQMVNIKETIDKAIQSFKPEFERDNVEVTTDLIDLEINHDPERIGQVMTNLIKNSLNVITPGSGKIHIQLEDRPNEVKISVKDNGVGIPEEKQKDLFKKFYQVDATLTREKGGSGLGLAICKGIIDNHYGVISVSSVPNQGATFSFTIPKEESESTKTPIST